MNKQQFCALVDGLCKQNEFTRDFERAISIVNTSWSVCDLSPQLTKAVHFVIKDSIGIDALDLVLEYIHENKRLFIFIVDEVEIEEKCGSASQLYDIIIKYYGANL